MKFENYPKVFSHLNFAEQKILIVFMLAISVIHILEFLMSGIFQDTVIANFINLVGILINCWVIFCSLNINKAPKIYFALIIYAFWIELISNLIALFSLFNESISTVDRIIIFIKFTILIYFGKYIIKYQKLTKNLFRENS